MTEKGDSVSRKWLTDAIRNRRTYLSYEDAKDVIDLIDNAPSVEYTFEEAFQKTVCENKLYCPAMPKGEWTIGYTAKQKKVAVCNLCNCISFQGKTNFCHNCGAKMKGGQNDRNQAR